MNKARRKEIDALFARLELLKSEFESLPDADDIKAGIEETRDAEQEAYDNLPESVQNGEQGSKMQECIEQLQTAADKAEEVATAITTAIDDLQEALDALDAARG